MDSHESEGAVPMTKNNFTSVQTGFHKRKIRYRMVTAVLILLTSILCLVMLYFGNTTYSPAIIFKVLLGEKIKGASFAVGTIRLPRLLAGLLAGLAFGMAGNTFQTMLRNPLASPDIIGVTSGSSVAAVFCILILKISGSIVSVSAVLSGIAVATLIYGLSRGGSFSGGRLILIGIGIQAMLNAVISFLILRANEHDVSTALRWLSGSLNGMQMKSIPGLFVVVVIFGGVQVLFGRQLKILELGDQSAVTLGLRTDQARLILVISSVFLIAYATAVTGPIAFVAFLAGPIAGRLAGAGAPNTIPAGLAGAILVLAADLIGQNAFGTRFPVGVITGILGAPYLIFLLIRINRTGGAA